VSRFFVPAVLVALVSGLALGLIGGIVARSPETHANVRPAGYDRTAVGYVGEVAPFEGFGLAGARVDSADPIARGRGLFLATGCAACHGLAAQGGAVGPMLDLEEIFREDFVPIVRSGPGGMPAFTDATLSDVDLDAIYGYLKAAAQATATP
jgi:mono/diheme cytochrome c family protein